MHKLVIMGAGQYGYVAKEVAKATGLYDSIEFLDDNSEMAVGKLEDISTIAHDAAFVAMGNPELREHWLGHVTKPATLVHPLAVVMPGVSIGAGSIVEPGAVISSNASVGMGTIVMANAVVGHDAKVGNFCQLKYNCSIPERSIVPDKTKVDCNVRYLDKAAVEALNKEFIEAERKRTGAEPGYF